MNKVCSKCQIEKDLTEYRKDCTKKDGLRPECKTCVKNFEKNKRNQNPDMMKEKLKKFYQENPEKRKIYRENYKPRKHEQRKERRNQDIIFSLINNVRTSLYKYLNKMSIKRETKTSQIIGCTPEKLKEHIEKQFKNGMTWENRRDWNIDHIIPLSSAKTKDELYKLCHYTNLQPLWSLENLKKG